MIETLTLYIKEDNFLAIAIMVLRTYDIFSSVFQFDPVDDEGVIVAVISLHEFHRLS